MLFNKVQNQHEFMANIAKALESDPAFKEALELTEKVNSLTVANNSFSMMKLAEVMANTSDQSIVSAFEMLEFGSFCMAYFGAEMIKQGYQREDVASLSNVKLFAAKMASGEIELPSNGEVTDHLGKKYENLAQRNANFFRAE